MFWPRGWSARWVQPPSSVMVTSVQSRRGVVDGDDRSRRSSRRAVARASRSLAWKATGRVARRGRAAPSSRRWRRGAGSREGLPVALRDVGGEVARDVLDPLGCGGGVGDAWACSSESGSVTPAGGRRQGDVRRCASYTGRGEPSHATFPPHGRSDPGLGRGEGGAGGGAAGGGARDERRRARAAEPATTSRRRGAAPRRCAARRRARRSSASWAGRSSWGSTEAELERLADAGGAAGQGAGARPRGAGRGAARRRHHRLGDGRRRRAARHQGRRDRRDRRGPPRAAGRGPASGGDVSADLDELARQPVCVVSSGAQGDPGSRRDGGGDGDARDPGGGARHPARCRPSTPTRAASRWSIGSRTSVQAAALLRLHWDALRRSEGVLLLVPPPRPVPREVVEAAVRRGSHDGAGAGRARQGDDPVPARRGGERDRRSGARRPTSRCWSGTPRSRPGSRSRWPPPGAGARRDAAAA